jgi:hypothetical protein
MEGSYEDGKKHSYFTTDGEFLHEQNDYQLLKQDSLSLS